GRELVRPLVGRALLSRHSLRGPALTAESHAVPLIASPGGAGPRDLLIQRRRARARHAGPRAPAAALRSRKRRRDATARPARWRERRGLGRGYWETGEARSVAEPGTCRPAPRPRSPRPFSRSRGGPGAEAPGRSTQAQP